MAHREGTVGAARVAAMTPMMSGRGSGGAEGGCARGDDDDDVDGIGGVDGGADMVGRQQCRSRMSDLQRVGSGGACMEAQDCLSNG